MLGLHGDGRVSALRERQLAVSAGIGTRTDALPCVSMVAKVQLVSGPRYSKGVASHVLDSAGPLDRLALAARNAGVHLSTQAECVAARWT